MPLRLDIKKKLSARSDRVKCVDTHPTEPWTLASLYSGNCFIWDYNTQSLVKQFEVCSLPVRCAKFIVRKQWIVTAADDMKICVFNYNTLEKVHSIDAHSDYIRYVTVHPTMPYVLSSSDDMSIKLWDWDKGWTLSQTFEGHAHYVMMSQWNPKDTHIFASASLDRSIKVWGVGGSGSSAAAHFTLTGHTRGVNCLDYSPSGEKPYLVSGSDDKTVRVWDYQTKQCLQTLTGHTNNVTTTVFHPALPIILTGSEDGTVRVWHSATYRLEVTLNYLLERVWCIHCTKESINAAIGYDEGTVVIKMGSDEPIASMTTGGKIVWAKANEIQTANVKLLDEVAMVDGERLQLSVKDMGNSEIFPQSIHHHPNGRLFAVCGDGEYVVYTAQALRNKVFGQAIEFVWSWDGNYAIRDSNGLIKVFHNFKEEFSFKPPFAVDKMHGGRLLGIVGTDFIIFYHWEEFKLIRRIDIAPKSVFWSRSGESVVLSSTDSFFLLAHDPRYLAEAMASAQQPPDVEEEGYEEAFQVKQEVASENISSGQWVGDECFVFITTTQRINYLSAGQIELVAHVERPVHILTYLSEMSKLFVIDRENSVVSYTLNMDFIEYQSAIVRGELEAALHFFAKLPESLHNRVARFLEHQQYLQEALEISKDADHKFELALQLGKLAMAADILQEVVGESGEVTSSSRSKWKQLGDVALEQGDFELALKCFTDGQDFNSLFLLQISAGNVEGLLKTATLGISERKYNVAVMCYLLVQEPIKALEVLLLAQRYPEAAFFSRTYCPSQLSRAVKLWKEDLRSVNAQMAEILADPETYPDLFPGFQDTLKAEEIVNKKKFTSLSASKYLSVKEQLDFDIVEQIGQMGPGGFETFWLNLGGNDAEPEVSVAEPQPTVVKQPSVVEQRDIRLGSQRSGGVVAQAEPTPSVLSAGVRSGSQRSGGVVAQAEHRSSVRSAGERSGGVVAQAEHMSSGRSAGVRSGSQRSVGSPSAENPEDAPQPIAASLPVQEAQPEEVLDFDEDDDEDDEE